MHTFTSHSALPEVTAARIGGVGGTQETVKGADILIFCAPHQFVHGICKQLMGKINPDAIAISLTKVVP